MNSASVQTRTLAAVQSRLGRRAVQVVLGSLLVAICAQVTIPLWFTPVPVTLQTFAVVLLGLLLEPGVAASAMALYLIEGMAGLPVLSPIGPVGFLHIFGPTGGYLLAYPAAVSIIGSLRQRLGRGFAASAVAAGSGALLILLSGAAWFEILTGQPLGAVLMLTVTPFLAGETLKVAAAAGIASGMRRFRRS